MQVFRVGDEKVLDIVRLVENYVDTRLMPSLPPGVSATIWRDDAVEFKSRMRRITSYNVCYTKLLRMPGGRSST